ncbi:MAG TPA: MBL fold metallo-hydrolase [Opitutaceae bacterium]|nr:MBL fold metallo-hydrolase [Opitutaceae bacterium]
MLVRIRGAISNCYLLAGEKPVLVDTGAPGDLPKILAAFKQHQLEPRQLGLIVLTHGYSDHAGNAAELQRRSGAPVALQAGDVPLARTGRNGVLAPISSLARLIRPFVDETFEPFEPGIVFRDGLELAPYGIKGRVLATPGPTPGSSSIILAQGEALIGDLLRGSLLVPNRARRHFFCADPESTLRSLARLAREGLLRCHPGHFGSFPGSELPRFIAPPDGLVDLAEQPARV